MADLSITAANVAFVSGTKETVVAGATITAGQNVYKDTTDSNKYKLSDSNSATQLARSVDGIALHGASDTQPLVIQKTGVITIGATVGVGTVYVLSATPGGWALGCPGSTDLTTGMATFVLGRGITATKIQLIMSGDPSVLVP